MNTAYYCAQAHSYHYGNGPSLTAHVGIALSRMASDQHTVRALRTATRYDLIG